MARIMEFFAGLLMKTVRKIPAVERKIQQDYHNIMNQLEPSLKPYADDFETFANIPENGRDREDVLEDMYQMQALEERWKQGLVSGAVYHGGEDHIDFLNEVYALHSQCNPLHADLWPSIIKFESEVVAMTGAMLGAGVLPDGPCGVMTSGGTESILLAMKAYRDQGKELGISQPQVIAPVTAHAAFDKAAQYFGIDLVKIPIDSECCADISRVKRAISKNTVALVGSAPCFPHGTIDPIEQLSQLALERGIGFHTDACLGGFVLPWAKKLGYPVPPFDFSLPGVTSMSVDTHKYGYAPKGSSVVLYRDPKLRRRQFFKTADWPGGLYFSPTFAGSRPGALIAACWAAITSIGKKGYLDATKAILETAAKIKHGIGEIPELHILGDPLWVIAFGAKDLDIYRIMDFMAEKHWNLNGLHRPSCVHLCVTLRHTQPEIAEKFLADLKNAVAHVKENPKEKGGMAPVYGMAARMPDHTIVEDMLDQYLDLLYRVKR